MEPGKLQKIDPKPLPMELSVGDVVQRVMKIRDVMEHVMIEGEHFGTIPGTSKPTLYQPGVQKLLQVFMFRPEIVIEDAVREKDFISYIIKCDVVHIPTGNHIASGLGACNSREDKYRYRLDNTGRMVPKDYWKSQDPTVLGGPQFRPRKKAGKWFIFMQVENDNPWDSDNTILKMATKRAIMAATLNATAASDIFVTGEDPDGEPGPEPETVPEKEAPPERDPDQEETLMISLRELGEALGKDLKTIKDAIKGAKGLEGLEALKSSWEKTLREREEMKGSQGEI